MSLEKSLSTIRTLRDLPPLARTLGLEALWDDVPGEAWGGHGRCREPGMVVVARAGDFPWFALESAEPTRTVRSVGRRLLARGRVAGVFALDPVQRRMAVGVAFGAVPVLVIDLQAPAGTALASLSRLGGIGDGGALGYAARVADALSTEDVGHRFFREFRATLNGMVDGLPSTVRREDRHDFALLQLTRVLFLYFIQTKGWLAGRSRFLGEEVDRCLVHGRHVHRDLLRPLFFGTLNRPTSERTRVAAAFGSIPFLNGGLFEPHPLDRRCRSGIPNVLWRNAFDRVFERFHFAIAERPAPLATSRGSAPEHVGAVAPDMLGRVFEGVMDPEARRASGTFYTPAALVDRLIDAGLVELLGHRLRCGTREAERRLHDGDSTVVAALDAITLLDPAVGSGAFLLGALERLASVGGAPSAARRRRILQRNLFGVDRSPTAVRLTELRLWLAVIANDATERVADVSPLPNLDCLIRQGDSLLEPVSGRLDLGARLARQAGDLRALRENVVIATGRAKAAATRQLRAAELVLLGASLADHETLLRSEIAGCVADGRAQDLFGERRGLDRTLQARLRRLRAEFRETRRAHRAASHGEIPWFHYQSHFADVFARSGGFDLVVGNPPWQRAEAVAPAVRERLVGRYRWWRGRGGASGYGNPPDLAVAFLERALELTASDGVVSLLVPAKLTSASYGTTARHALATETSLAVIANLSTDADAGFDATVYPLALVTRKSPPAPGRRVRTTLDGRGPSVRQQRLAGGGPWLLLSDRTRHALEELRADHPRLDERLTCHLGVKTGANDLFLDPAHDLESEMIRRAVRGRDVKTFAIATGVRLLWTHDANGLPRTTLPPRAAAYLAPHHAVLRARADYAGGAPWTLFRVSTAMARHRVIWTDLARQLTAAALVGHDRDRIPLNTCYVISTTSDATARCVAAWLNSTWIRAAAQTVAVPASGGFARFNAAVVGALPLPTQALEDPELSSLAAAWSDGERIDVQASIDAIVARQLGLSPRGQTILRSLLHARTHHRR